MFLRNMIILCMLAMPLQSLGMQQLKNYLNNIVYHVKPASGNPLTWLGNNFHAVQENFCYRSKTMSPSALEYYIKKHGIKTILNLREAQGVWFAKEKEVADRMGVQLHTITLDSEQLPTQQQLKDILTLFHTAPKPILFHCQAGVDRTSLAAAFWKLMIECTSVEQALDQMTPSYGHFEWSRPFMRKCIQILDTLRDDGIILLDNYDPAEELRNIKISPLPVRALKSLATTMKQHPIATFGCTTLLAASIASIYAFRK